MMDHCSVSCHVNFIHRIPDRVSYTSHRPSTLTVMMCSSLWRPDDDRNRGSTIGSSSWRSSGTRISKTGGLTSRPSTSSEGKGDGPVTQVLLPHPVTPRLTIRPSPRPFVHLGSCHWPSLQGVTLRVTFKGSTTSSSHLNNRGNHNNHIGRMSDPVNLTFTVSVTKFEIKISLCLRIFVWRFKNNLQTVYLRSNRQEIIEITKPYW